MGIQLLDCTLRDGGHLNKSRFGEEIIKDIIFGLEQSGINILEIGFLRNEDFGTNYAAEKYIEVFEKRFGLQSKNTEYSIMIQEDQYHIDDLPPCNGRIKRIRVSFHDYDQKEGLQFCREVIKKGYICHINPINITGYSDTEILKLIDEANEMKASVFTLVDTFGSMTREDLLRLFTLSQHNLARNIAIGIHLHDNLQLAYALGQSIVELAPDERDIIIDGSLLGMGRPPGNLCIELMMDYLNKRYGRYYEVDTALDLIDNIISPLKQKYLWGYETAYALSAQYKVHRSYAEFLIKKQKLKTKQIRHMLGKIEKDKKTRFDAAYIEGIYKDFLMVDIDDSEVRSQLKQVFFKRNILFVAPGASLNKYKLKIQGFIQEKNPVILSANFKCDFIDEDYVFCSNIKRYDRLKWKVAPENCIITSSLSDIVAEKCKIVNINRYAWFGDVFWDNCMLMLIHLLQSLGETKCFVVGWDGFSENENFVSEDMESIYHYQEENQRVRDILHGYLKNIEIEFITPSLYKS